MNSGSASPSTDATAPHVLDAQYATGEALRARNSMYDYVQLDHDLSVSFPAWVLDHVDCRGAVVADVGCGPGPYAEELADRSRLAVGIDRSVGILAEVAVRTSSAGYWPAGGDATSLPLADASVDGLLSAHMLYHVEPIAGAVSEFRRILRPNGWLVLVLNGSTDKQELRELWVAAMRKAGVESDPPWWSRRANLDNAADLVAEHFKVERLDRLPGRFRFTDPDPPMRWLQSLRPGAEESFGGDSWQRVSTLVRQSILEAIDDSGEFVVTKDSGVVIARPR